MAAYIFSPIMQWILQFLVNMIRYNAVANVFNLNNLNTRFFPLHISVLQVTSASI